MKVSLISNKQQGQNRRKVIATPKDEASPLMVEVQDFTQLVRREVMISLAIEQHPTRKWFYFRAHTLTHPEGIQLVTRRNKRRPRLLKTVDKAIEVFQGITGINVFSEQAKISAGVIQIPFKRPFTVIEIEP